MNLSDKQGRVASGTHADPSSPGARRHGALLVNLGTPDKPELPAVRAYLAEFLSDPEVIRLPRALRWLNRPLGHMIAHRRASKSTKMYRQIWTERGSPLGSITQEQASALKAILPSEWQVFHAMRYGQPSIAHALAEIDAAGVEELVVVPMYPQFSGTTSGTAVRELYGCLKNVGHRPNVKVRTCWYDDGGYVHAQAKLIFEYARAHDLSPENCQLVFSMHGLPVSYVEQGDPYTAHVRRTMELVAERLGWPADRIAVGFQSRMGPVKWLQPNIDSVLQELVESGEKRLLVCPISFVVDCLETLQEIDVRYRALVESSGGDLFLCPALNTFPPFISALKELVMRGPRPIASWGDKVSPLLAASRKDRAIQRDTDSLVMIGVSIANRLGGGSGPPLTFSTPTGLCTTKTTTHEVPPILREVCEHPNVREGFLWNTCCRFEFYGWLSALADETERQEAIDHVRQKLFADETCSDLTVNVLTGRLAWHHLMRTATGLNSGLPGDRDVLDQLQTAYRVAERAGTAGPLASQLIKDAQGMEGDVRGQTVWGAFDPGFCQAALSRIVEVTGLDLAASRCAVFGGSSTSRSVLTSLAERFDVPTRQATLVYRGHGSGQIKLLRKAIGNGKRVRVSEYSEVAVNEVVADADVVLFGIDSHQPVLDADRIRDLRDYTERPLTVIDFNTFGSTTGLDALEGVTVWDAKRLDEEVATYSEAMCAREEFSQGVEEAEQWIIKQTPVFQCHVAHKPTPAICKECGQHKGRCAELIAELAGISV